MADPVSAAADPDQVARFVARIAADRDAELAAVAQARDAEIARLRGAAHAESRRLLRLGAEQVRARLAQERGRHLARVRADLRRREWEILADAQQRVLDAVLERLADAWRDPDRQWEWCRFWLLAALERLAGETPRVTLGRGGLEPVRARLEGWLGERFAGAAVRLDEDVAPGIVIGWGDYLMDGRLASQRQAIGEAVLERLAALLHDADDAPRR